MFIVADLVSLIYVQQSTTGAPDIEIQKQPVTVNNSTVLYPQIVCLALGVFKNTWWSHCMFFLFCHVFRYSSVCPF